MRPSPMVDDVVATRRAERSGCGGSKINAVLMRPRPTWGDVLAQAVLDSDNMKE
jgi:hypothetical protein